jgi:hypothetical protein
MSQSSAKADEDATSRNDDYFLRRSPTSQRGRPLETIWSPLFPALFSGARYPNSQLRRRKQRRRAFDPRKLFTESTRKQNLPHYIPHFSQTPFDDTDVCTPNFLENTGVSCSLRNFKTRHLVLLINRFRVQVPAGALLLKFLAFLRHHNLAPFPLKIRGMPLRTPAQGSRRSHDVKLSESFVRQNFHNE